MVSKVLWLAAGIVGYLALRNRQIDGNPPIPPITPTTLPSIVDTFNRPDNVASLGVTNTGQAWQILRGTFGILGGQAYTPVQDFDHLAAVESGRSDGTVSVILAQLYTNSGGIAGQPALYFRVVDADNWLRVLAIGANSLYLQRSISGNQVNLRILQGLNFTNGDVLAARLSGNTVSILQNGAERLTFEVPQFSTATKHGFGNAAGSTDARWGTFRVD